MSRCATWPRLRPPTAARPEKFLPYGGQLVAGMIACCLGSVDRHLGMAASVLGRWEEAETHFEGALVVDGGMRSPPLLARTRYWYARMLAASPTKLQWVANSSTFWTLHTPGACLLPWRESLFPLL